MPLCYRARMLLDQKRTKRMVKIISIICAVAFVGVLPVVLGVILFSDNDPSGQQQLIKDAESAVSANPSDIQALVDLASRYRSAGRADDANATINRAIAVPPKTADDVSAVVYALADTPPKQLSVLKTFTTSHPKNAEAWLLYGQIAEQQTQALTARLAYGRALATAGTNATIRRDAQEALQRVATMQTESTPTVTSPGVVTATTAP